MSKKQSNSGRELYERKIKTGEFYADIALDIDATSNSVRKRVQRYYTSNNLPPPSKISPPRVVGGMQEEPKVNGKELWDRAIRIEKRQEEIQEFKSGRRIVYDIGPVVIVFIADPHLGGTGVRYSEVDRDIRTINALAEKGVNVGVMLVGDLLDGFIVGRLQELRKHTSPFLQIEEWGLVDYALERLAPYLLGSVAGNHDNWSWALTGIDLLRQRHRELTPGILYDQQELSFILQVGDYKCPVTMRHKWRGNSMYNPSHGIDSHQHRRGRAFDVAVGAHTHRGALAREFDNGGRVGYALLCGSYKKIDGYAEASGFPPPLPTSAVALVVDESGVLHATSNIDGLLRVFQ